jgi:nucleoside-diphosphate-sugar epimerase
MARKKYHHPGRCDPPKSFGYVGNTVHQILALLNAPEPESQGRTFYLTDYENITIRQWAKVIAGELGVPYPTAIPTALAKLAARTGDWCKRLGWANPPLTTFRLRNMWQDTTGLPIDELKRITGPLPFTMEQGVSLTVKWLRESGQIE